MNSPPADVPPPDDSAWALRARERLAQMDALLAQRFDRNEEIDSLTRSRAAGIDALIREAWHRCIDSNARMSLFAVGGYGRGELYPGSDIDLLVLVVSTVSPAPNRFVLDKMLAVAEHKGIEPMLAVTKSDLRRDPELLADYRKAGYRCLELSSATGEGVAELREQLNALRDKEGRRLNDVIQDMLDVYEASKR